MHCSRLMLFTEMIADCSDNHTKHISRLYTVWGGGNHIFYSCNVCVCVCVCVCSTGISGINNFVYDFFLLCFFLSRLLQVKTQQ